MATPCVGEPREERRGVRHLEDDDVRLDRRRVELDARQLRQPVGEPRGVGVVLGQPLDVVVERVQAARRDDARLAHRAADHLLVAPGLVDQLRATRRAPRRPVRRAPW